MGWTIVTFHMHKINNNLRCRVRFHSSQSQSHSHHKSRGIHYQPEYQSYGFKLKIKFISYSSWPTSNGLSQCSPLGA